MNDSPGVTISACGQERADDIARLTHLAFARYVDLDPPTRGMDEGVDIVRADLESGGGAIAELDGRAVGCLRWLLRTDGALYVRRVAVDPTLERLGIGTALMSWADAEAERRGCASLEVGVRIALPENIAFFTARGFKIVGEHRHDGYELPTYVEMRKPVDAATP